MKLLLDQNLSHALAQRLKEVFADVRHVRDFGLERAGDQAILDFAREQGFTIILRICEFQQLSFQMGWPAKVVWLNVGKCSTHAIEGALREYAEQLLSSNKVAAASFVVIG